MAKKKTNGGRDARNLQLQRVVFVGLGLIVVLSMIIGMVAK